MPYLILLFGLSFLAMVVFSCKSKEKQLVNKMMPKDLTVEEIRALPKVLSYSKSPCYGFCPHFDMAIHEGGWMIFEGKRHTAHKGVAILKMDETQMNRMVQQYKEADLWSAEEAYGMRIQDLPTTTVQLFETNRKKAVQWRMKEPERLDKLDKQLLAFITEQGWIAPAAETRNPKATKQMEATIENELIIQLRDKLKGVSWVENYRKYGMHLKKPISKLANMYLFVFDTTLIDSEKMLEIVLKDENVARAEFNKQLQPRNR